jgi:hypothetical protein
VIAAVTTLSFLVAAWATVYAVIVSLDDSSAKVVAGADPPGHGADQRAPSVAAVAVGAGEA